MMRLFGKKEDRPVLSPEEWKQLWQSLVPESCRDVPVTVDGHTEIAFVCMNHFVMMLQDGLLMEASFFDVCEHFQKAGYHVIWLMRCVQDVKEGYLKQGKASGGRIQWIWKSPTTNFGRWTSDNRGASIVLQYRQVPEEGLLDCRENILQRVAWAESDREEKMVPGRTVFYTVDTPGTPKELLRWLQGESLGKLKISG